MLSYCYIFIIDKGGQQEEDDDSSNAMGKSPLSLACTYGQLANVEKQLKVNMLNCISLNERCHILVYWTVMHCLVNP